MPGHYGKKMKGPMTAMTMAKMRKKGGQAAKGVRTEGDARRMSVKRKKRK